MEYLGAWGSLIHEKKLKSKILCQTPFNSCIVGMCLPIYMIGEVSWDPKRRRVWASSIQSSLEITTQKTTTFGKPVDQCKWATAVLVYVVKITKDKAFLYLKDDDIEKSRSSQARWAMSLRIYLVKIRENRKSPLFKINYFINFVSEKRRHSKKLSLTSKQRLIVIALYVFLKLTKL